jgi:predicted DNA-binding transcriptional regulator AlpA
MTPQSRLTMREAAQFLGRSYSWLYANCRTLGLNPYRIGGRLYFDPRDLEAWEANLKAAGSSYRKTNSRKLVIL